MRIVLANQHDIEASFELDRKNVICKCPRCERLHEHLMQWSGRGTPRVFCSNCRSTTSSYGDMAMELLSISLVKGGRCQGHLDLD